MKKFLLLILFTLSLILVGCDFKDRPKPEDLGLSSVSDEKDLNRLIEKSNKSSNRWNWSLNWLFGGFAVEDADNASITSRSKSAPEYQGSEYTKTNVQVEGIDEGDIMKTDGSRIYSISTNSLQVINLLGEGKMELLFNQELKSDGDDEQSYSNTYYTELYLTDKYLVVIGQRHSYNYVYHDQYNIFEFIVNPKLPYFCNYTTMSVVEVYDKETIEKVDDYQVSGSLIGSRLIEDQLYIIANHYAYTYSEEYEFDSRPWYKHKDEIKYFEYEDIKYLPNTDHSSFTIISTINLDKKVTVDNNVFLSFNYWNNIYVSENAIYLASQQYESNIFSSNLNFKGTLVSYQFDQKTGKAFYGGYTEFKGRVLNQFAIDEYDGYIRMATTDGTNDVVNRIYVFKRTLKDDAYILEQVGLLDSGIGKPGERIQSVRFNKEIATVVTFLRTDPFYTIDLSDPTKPVISGELEIPGFSTYQHPWSENLVIGIGFDADDNGRTTGLKLSLYDISDINNPLEVGNPLIFSYSAQGYNFSEATFNHKAIMIDKARNTMGFQLRRYDHNRDPYFINEYIIFDVDETSDQPITIKHKFTHDNYYHKYTDLFSRSYWQYEFQIQRAFRVDDHLYLLSGEAITSHNLIGDITKVDEIIYKQHLNIE